MSEAKAEAKRPKVLRVMSQVPVHLAGGGGVSSSFGGVPSTAGGPTYAIERTPGGVLLRYEGGDGTGKKVKRTSFIPDTNIAVMDLDEGQ